MNTAKPQAVQQEHAEIAEEPENFVASVSSCSKGVFGCGFAALG
jgi:hypothetical protein